MERNRTVALRLPYSRLLSGLLLSCLLIIHLYAFATSASAQESKAKHKRLLSSSARAKAINQRSINLGRQRTEVEDDENLYNEILDRDGVEGFNDYILATPPRGQYLSLYRGIAYLEYLDDVTDVRAFDEVTTRSVTEKLILFQTAETATKLLLDSPLAELYRRAQRYFRTYQDYTTVKVDRGSQVKLHVGTETSSENTFLRFRIHTSMREGIEPRLEIGENTRLKYDILSQETVLEYGFEF